LLDQQRPDQADHRAVVGEDADDVRASGDLLVDPLEVVGRAQLGPVGRWEAVEGEQVLLGLFEQRGDLRNRRRQPLDHRGCSVPGVAQILGVEDLAQGGGDHVALPLLAVAVHVADEMHGAALPGAAQHLGDRGLEAEVVVGDAEPHPLQSAGAQLAQEGRPAGLGLGLGDLDADHLASS
jgi:hypothetical protein